MGMVVGMKRVRTALGRPSDQQGKTHSTVGCARVCMQVTTLDTRTFPFSVFVNECRRLNYLTVLITWIILYRRILLCTGVILGATQDPRGHL